MLATARLTGQTIGATLAAISFRLAANAETFALGVAALFAAGAAMASLWRLRHASASTPAQAIELMIQLEAEMKSAAAELRYEEAALLRDEIAELRASVPS